MKGEKEVMIVRMLRFMKNVLLYFVAVICAIEGIYFVTQGAVAGVMFLLCALFTAPVFHRFIESLCDNRGVKRIRPWMYILIVMVFFIQGVVLFLKYSTDETSMQIASVD